MVDISTSSGHPHSLKIRKDRCLTHQLAEKGRRSMYDPLTANPLLQAPVSSAWSVESLWSGLRSSRYRDEMSESGSDEVMPTSLKKIYLYYSPHGA